MWAKIGLFSAFVVVFVAYFALASWWGYQQSQRYNQDGSWQPQSRLRRLAEAQIVVLNPPTYLFYIYLLTGFFSLPLFVLWTASIELGVLVGELLTPGDRTRAIESRAHLIWASYLLARRGMMAYGFGVLLAIVIMVAFPIAVGVVFFTHERPSPELTEATLKVTLALTALLAYLIGAPMSIAYLTSVHLDDQSRTRHLVGSVMGLLPAGISLGLLFWAFNIGSTGPVLALGSVPIALSSPFVVVFLVLFVLRALGPFLIGMYRAKKYRLTLLEDERTLLSKVLGVFDLPGPSAIEREVEQFQLEANAAADGIVEAGFLATLGAQDAPASTKRVAWAGSVLKGSDPLLKHHVWLMQLSQTLRDITDALSRARSATAKDRLREGCAVGYGRRRDDLTDDIEALRKRRGPHVVAWTFIGVPLLSVGVSELARFMATNYLHAALR